MPKGKFDSSRSKKGRLDPSNKKGRHPKASLRQEIDAALAEVTVPPIAPLDPLSQIKELLKKQKTISGPGGLFHSFWSPPGSPLAFSRHCRTCGELKEEIEISPEGRIFLSYCWLYTDQETGEVGHGRRDHRREIVWDGHGQFIFPPDSLDIIFDTVGDALATGYLAVVGPVEEVVGGVIKGVFGFMYCKCSSPDPDSSDMSEIHICRRCGKVID